MERREGRAVAGGSGSFASTPKHEKLSVWPERSSPLSARLIAGFRGLGTTLYQTILGKGKPPSYDAAWHSQLGEGRGLASDLVQREQQPPSL